METTTPQVNQPTSPAQSDFTAQLTDMLKNQSGMITSNTTQMEQQINDAIANVNRSNEASKAVTTSQYNRQIADQTAANQRQITSFQEETRGYATNTAALRTMVEQADKSVKDLEQRKQELLLQGDAQAASKVAEMQLKTLDMRTNAMQKTFDNLLQIGSYSIQASQEKRATAAQTFSERSAINSIALQYGVTPREGDTIDTVTARAMPFATQKQKLELAKTQADINKVNAEAAKYMSEAGNALNKNNLSSLDFEAITEAYRNTPPEKQLGFLQSFSGKLSAEQAVILQGKINKVDAEEKAKALFAAQNTYKEPVTLPGLVKGFASTVVDTNESLRKFLGIPKL